MINKNKFLKFIMTIATIWWVFWSNVRFKKCTKDVEILEEDDINCAPATVKSLAKRLYKKFNYTDDGIDKLWDAITPPAQNYQDYLLGEVKDDCDGFHSLLLHVLAKCRDHVECYLLSVVARGGGHCVLVYRYKKKWYVMDYTTVYKGFPTIEEAVEDYNNTYVEKYKLKGKVFFNGLVKFNYNKKKFERESFNKIERS